MNNKIKDTPLKFAEELSKIVNNDWNSGIFLNKVSEITKSLLEYWFGDEFCENRKINFHSGQKQAILNTIYCFEVLKCANLLELYSVVAENCEENFINDESFNYIKETNYSRNKYCVKMATGTGKTFVMNAIFIWQYLNSKLNKKNELNWIKNFLFIAPGIIVYDRLIDSFKGKIIDNSEIRDFNTSDIKKHEELFIPMEYRDILYHFIQNNTLVRDELGKKTTGDGFLAITNWHFLNKLEEEEIEEEVEFNDLSLDNNKKIINELLPINLSQKTGTDLSTLDSRYFNGESLQYLINLDNICILNDEAHHIHNDDKNVAIWQKIINTIVDNKINNSLQIDFSATPFESSKKTVNKKVEDVKNYFPHIIVNYELKSAIIEGIVKLISIDKRRHLSELENDLLEFNALRDEKNTVIGLSEGQKIMIKAGLTRLNILNENFVKISKDENGLSDKHPKMLIMCEDTNVVPFIEEYLKNIGLKDAEFERLDTKKQFELKEDEWRELKNKVFNIDKSETLKVIISVLMLREGFDVNNICVIVPLRSNESTILLEQTIGRGLRLMWRESDFEELKKDNRRDILELKKEQPSNFLDMLFIVEHPRFNDFYNDYINDGTVIDVDFEGGIDKILGDLIEVGLKENYKDYDLFWPIIKENDENNKIQPINIDYNDITPLEGYNLEQLKSMLKNYKNEYFRANEIINDTKFGEFHVEIKDIYANSYNEYLLQIIKKVENCIKEMKDFPLIQIYKNLFIGLLDNYIKHRMFGQEFNPVETDNWKILMLSNTNIISHIIKEFVKIYINISNDINMNKVTIEKKYFSCLEKIRIRENYSLKLQKTIYEKLSYPSNKGGFEKKFMEACDKDGKVEAFIKIKERSFDFIKLNYIRKDGFLGRYYPDFMVKTKDYIFIVETKGIIDENVKKKEISCFDFVNRVNEINKEQRDNRKWIYVLLIEENFNNFIAKNATIEDMLLNFRCRKTGDNNIFDEII